MAHSGNTESHRGELSATPRGIAEMAAREAPATELHGGNLSVELPSGDVGDGNRVTAQEKNVSLVA